MKKKLIFLSLFFLFCLFFCFGKTEQAQAGTGYKVINAYSESKWNPQKSRTVGKTIFEYSNSGGYGCLYATKNGKRMLLASRMGLGGDILTNGTTVYYYVGQYPNYSVYRIASIGKKSKKVFSAKNVEDIHFAGWYSGKIFYVTGIDGDAVFSSYDTKNSKKKAIVTRLPMAKQCKHYFYLTKYEGVYGPGSFYVYNAKTGKTKTISTKEMNYDVISNYVYYVEGKLVRSGSYAVFKVAVKRCRLDGSSKKTLVKNLKIRYVEKIRKDAIIYINENGKKKTKKF